MVLVVGAIIGCMLGRLYIQMSIQVKIQTRIRAGYIWEEKTTALGRGLWQKLVKNGGKNGSKKGDGGGAR